MRTSPSPSSWRLRLACLTLLGSVVGGGRAHAQMRLDLLAQRQPDVFAHLTSPRLNAGKPARLIVRNTTLNASLPRVAAGNAFSVVAASDARDLPHLVWSPPKRLLLDEATQWIHLDAYRDQVMGTVADAGFDDSTPAGRGAGVVVGIVDGGIDFAHPDLRHADGSTRVAWFLDFSSAPLGQQSELEDEFGCTQAASPCAVLSAADIDAALARAADDLPQDAMGHGTHVASLAAGGGHADGRYTGVAPEATLVVARIADASNNVQDADVLVATQFVFDRADALGMPAVVNLSLGGDFGPHDGSTLLEQALVDFVDVPGRAVVVAAGNSAGVFLSGPTSLPGPFGIHTDIHVDGSGSAVLVVPNEQDHYDGDIFVWVDTASGASLDVGVASGTRTVVSPVARAATGEGSTADWDAFISNQASVDVELVDFEGGALVLLTGRFSKNEIIEVQLKGEGTASLWVQSSGELGPSNSRGALFSSARRGATITVPATAPGLIAVGATLNRVRWPSPTEGETRLFPFSNQLDETPGSVAFFSSLGPNQLGYHKPDILAPGAMVIGAMAPSADPFAGSGLVNEASMFMAAPMCGDELLCAVVDEAYGIALGTSMAAPLVTGAAALLLAENPQLSQNQILNALRSGATRIDASATTPAEEAALPPGPGLLDVVRTRAALISTPSESEPSPDTSWITLSDAYVTPGGLVRGLLRVRDDADLPVEIASTDLKTEVNNGDLETELQDLAPGLFEFTAGADAAKASGIQGTSERDAWLLTVTVTYAEETLAHAELPIARDLNELRGVGRSPRRLARESGCSVSGVAQPDLEAPFAGALWLAWAWLYRRRTVRRAGPDYGSSVTYKE